MGARVTQQDATVDGNFNIIVQAQGDGIAIDINQPFLTLSRRHRRSRVVRKEIDLLNPEKSPVPLIGRDADLADLQAWLTNGAPLSARCLIGRAGSGKTRLGLELCQWAESQGWFAGFVEADELGRFSQQQNLASWGWPKPTLIVVDYAASKARILRDWLGQLAQNPGDAARPLRLVLLERHAHPQPGWWSELLRVEGWGDDDLQDLFDPPAPIELPSITDPEHRRRILAEVMALACEHLNKSAVAPPVAGINPDFDARLASPDLTYEPLYLLMAGVHAANEGVAHILALQRTDLAARLAGNELGRICKLATDRGIAEPDGLAYLAAITTLQGGMSRDDLQQVIAEEGVCARFGGALHTFEQALPDALPSEIGDAIAPILPDLIGEAVLIEVFSKQTEGQQGEIIQRAFARAPGQTLEAIIRTAQDYAFSLSHPAHGWIQAVMAVADDPAFLRLIADQLPDQTVNLRERAIEIESLIANRLRARCEKIYDEDTFNALATSLDNLGIWMCRLGRYEEAFNATQEAIDIYLNLAAVRPDAVHPDLAMSLNNLGSRLSALGRREEALNATQRAAQVWRELAAVRSDAVLPELARSLTNLGVAMSDLGRREEALDATYEAVGICRDLSSVHPDVFRPDLAASLHNLAKFLSELGRREEALEAASEAAELYRELSQARPDAFRPDLATSLNSLANRLSALGQREEALDAAYEAVKIYHDLSQVRPDTFRPDLALSLLGLAVFLGDLGRPGAALFVAQQATDLYRDLTQECPDAFRPDLALSLTNLANFLNDLGRYKDALNCGLEAVNIRRELAAAYPDTFHPDLAVSLNNLANVLRDMDRKEEALTAIHEATSIMAPLFLKLPMAYARGMHMVLRSYARLCKDLRHEPDMQLLGPVIEELRQMGLWK